MTYFKSLPSITLTLGLVFACAVAQVNATEICFRSTANVSGSTVMLRDVATVSGGDAETVKRLEQTVLGPAPAPGRSTRLDFDEMRSRLEATGVSTADATFSGAAVVVVSCNRPVVPIVRQPKRKTRVNVSETQVRRAEKIMTQSVRQSLRARSRAGNLVLDVVVDPTDVPIILASASEGFELGSLDPKNANSQNVQVLTQDSQGRPVKFQIQCMVSEKPRVPVLNRSVSGGEVIREDDLSWKQVDTTEGALATIDEIVGKEAKKGLHPDEPLHADDVRTIPLVRSNDIVTGIWQKGGIRVSGQFKAKSDGGKGDVITLVQLTGREQVLARVTDVHEAVIVAADAIRTAKGDADDQQEEAAPPVRTVSHQTTRKKTRRVPPPVVDASATDDGGAVSNPTVLNPTVPKQSGVEHNGPEFNGPESNDDERRRPE
jgi:flagella basal body P-ring formation protein FlgA